MTYGWLSAKVAESEALDDLSLKSHDPEAREKWWQQRQALGEHALDFARQHPKEGRALFAAMTVSEHEPDRRFICNFMADYMNIEGREEDGGDNFALLLLHDHDVTVETARFVLDSAARDGKLAAVQVAGIAFAVAELAERRIQRLEATQRPQTG